MVRGRTAPTYARTASRYLPYRSVRARNETGHKCTPRCGSPLVGEIFLDRRSAAAAAAAAGPPLSYVPNFIGDAGKKEEKSQ